jgi:hypothetical protein
MEANHILKFRKINEFLIDSLKHSQIYFARPDELNDPFDCKVNIEKSLKKAISQLSGSERETLENIFNNNEVIRLFNQAQQDINNYGIFSGSHKPALECSQMWSHYADKHRGVCLIYAIPTEPVEFFRQNQIIGIQNVIYGSNQLTEWFKKLPANKSIHNFAFEEMIKTFVKIKHINWKYEDEVRMIRKTSGLVSIDRSYLQHVCFGLKASEDSIRELQEILIKFNYDTGYSQMYNGDSDFALRAIDID